MKELALNLTEIPILPRSGGKDTCIMDICWKRGRRLRECIVDGLNCLCVGKSRDVQSQDRREQKEKGPQGPWVGTTH